MATFDVIFLGGGPAGYEGAIRAAQLGFSTAVVEREGLGGTCVLWGCIPAKALLESASLAHQMQHAGDFGVKVEKVSFDYGVAMKRSRAVSQQNSKGVEFLFKKHKITWLKGTGRLAGGRTVAVKSAEGKEEKHDAKKAVVISTGSRVRGLPQIGLELNGTTVLSSDDVLVLEKAPKTLAVIGAGAVGCEFADVFSSFGTQLPEAQDRRHHRRTRVGRDGEEGRGHAVRRVGRREEGSHGGESTRGRGARAQRGGAGAQGGRRPAHGTRLHPDQRAHGDECARHFRDRGRRGSTDAGAQGIARRRRPGGAAGGAAARAPRELRQRAQRH